MPTSDGSAGGQTSLAGSCGADFGDTDQSYQDFSPPWAVNFAYPRGGDVFSAGSDGDDLVASIGYAPESSYGHVLIVTQFGPVENRISADDLIGGAGWEAGQPVTFDGTERPVAVKPESNMISFLFGFETQDGNSGVRVEVAAGSADPCLATYRSVGRRVLDSVSPRA